MGGAAAAASPAVVALPLGFLEELAAAQEAETLGTIMGPVGEWLVTCQVVLGAAIGVVSWCRQYFPKELAAAQGVDALAKTMGSVASGWQVANWCWVLQLAS
jgi:hypothetical protein